MKRRTLAAWLAAAPLAACAPWMPPMSAVLHAQHPAGLPDRVALDDTPFFPQTEYACGPAALATVLGATGVTADPQALAAEVFLPARKGSLQAEMLAGARRHGTVAVRLPPNLEALLREIAAGTPVVVLQNLGLSYAPLWHYAVAIGFDLGAEELLLRSGTTRREAISLRTFEHTWARSGHWAFVAVAPGQLPASAREQDVVEALVGFERVAAPAAAVRAFESALGRWPDNLALAVGFGNSLFATGRLQQAEAAFAAAAQHHDSAAAWNNLARTRLALRREQPAREAALRAVARAESAEPQWLPAARETLAATATPLH